MEQTNLYYQQHLDGQDRPSCQLPDITLLDMMTFIALVLQMWHELKHTLHDYWSRIRQLHTPFYGETMTQDRFLHILHFLHFADNSKRSDQGEGYDQLWKLRTVFYTLKKAYAEFYNPQGKFGIGQGKRKIQGHGYLQAVHSKEKKMFQHQNLKTVMNQGTHMIWECTHAPPFPPTKCSWYSFMLKAELTPGPSVPLSWNLGTLTSWNPLGHPKSATGLLTFTWVKTHSLPLTWQQHTQLFDIWLAELKT